MKTTIIVIKTFLFFTVLTGIIYPLFVTGMAQIAFPAKANGSLIIKDNKKVGSALIGQQFDSAIYFTSRPSAISYNPLPSGGSNYGLTNAKLIQLVNERKQQFIIFNELDSNTIVPSDMLFASASGLDPHMSPKAACLQMGRVAKARHLDSIQRQELEQLIKDQAETSRFLCFGMERVNVLLLNLGVEKIK
jgi:potassium-transporting ATPase KdpC subunit